MAAVLKQKIRSSVLNWKLSIKTTKKNDDAFKDNVFRELESLMESVFNKHDGSVRRSYCHSIVDIWPMTERIIAKLHEGICKRLRVIPVTASPYFGSFTREVPREVFDVISNAIINHNSFGHTLKSTAAQVKIAVHDERKAVWFFNHMNDEGVKVKKDELLVKKFDDGSCAQVVFSEEQPMILKYSMNCETLKVTFHYGVWNSFGVAQH